MKLIPRPRQSQCGRRGEAPEFRAKIGEPLQLEPSPGSAEDFDRFIRTQVKDVSELVNYLGIKPE